MLENLGLYTRKYLFPGILIIVGFVLVVLAVLPEDIIEKTQTTRFLIGGICILTAGIVSLLYVLEIISKIVHFAVMGILFVVCIVLTVYSVKSVQETMALIELEEAYDDNAVQSLDDIRTIQLAYKKVNGLYAPDFAELKRFLMLDEVYKTIPTVLHESGVIPDRQPNAQEIAILGYDPIEDEDFILDGIDEEEAIKLGYFKIDTVWVPVLEDLFTGEEAMNSEIERAFPFDPSKLDIVRTPNSDSVVRFVMESKALDSLSNAFTVYDPYQYNPFKLVKKVPFRLGNLADGSTNGSWEQ